MLSGATILKPTHQPSRYLPILISAGYHSSVAPDTLMLSPLTSADSVIFSRLPASAPSAKAVHGSIVSTIITASRLAIHLQIVDLMFVRPFAKIIFPEGSCCPVIRQMRQQDF